MAATVFQDIKGSLRQLYLEDDPLAGGLQRRQEPVLSAPEGQHHAGVADF